MGLEPTSGCWPLPAFQAGSSSGRLASVAASTSSTSGGWNRTNDLLVQSQASLPAATTPDRSSCWTPPWRPKFGEKGSNLRLLVQSQAAYLKPIPDRVINKSALRESNPPSQLGRLGPLPIGQGHAKRKERKSNPQGLLLARVRAGCHRQLACPSVSSCGGRNRTCAGAVNPPKADLPVPTRVPPQSSQRGRI